MKEQLYEFYQLASVMNPYEFKECLIEITDSLNKAFDPFNYVIYKECVYDPIKSKDKFNFRGVDPRASKKEFRPINRQLARAGYRVPRPNQ